MNGLFKKIINPAQHKLQSSAVIYNEKNHFEHLWLPWAIALQHSQWSVWEYAQSEGHWASGSTPKVLSPVGVEQGLQALSFYFIAVSATFTNVETKAQGGYGAPQGHLAGECEPEAMCSLWHSGQWVTRERTFTLSVAPLSVPNSCCMNQVTA